MSTIALCVVGTILYVIFRPADSSEKVAREMLACVERGDGACVNRLRWDAEKIRSSVSDQQLTQFLRDHVGKRITLNEPAGESKLETDGAITTITREYRQGTLSFNVTFTGEKYQVVSPITLLILNSAGALDPKATGRNRGLLWVKDVEEHVDYFESLGINGLELGPDDGFVTWKAWIASRREKLGQK